MELRSPAVAQIMSLFNEDDPVGGTFNTSAYEYGFVPDFGGDSTDDLDGSDLSSADPDIYETGPDDIELPPVGGEVYTPPSLDSTATASPTDGTSPASSTAGSEAAALAGSTVDIPGLPPESPI